MKEIIALSGDGIGPEIMESALAILAQASQTSSFTYQLTPLLIGGASIDEYGEPLTEATLNACKQADAILLGGVGGHQWNECPQTPEKGLLNLRQALGLYANLRPIKGHDFLEAMSPLKSEYVRGTDFIIVREFIGGLYYGKPKYVDQNEAFDTLYYSREQIEAIVHYAFQLAMTRRMKVSSIDKANALASSKLWRRIVNEIAPTYPSVEVEHLYVDAAAMKLMTSPSSFDVIVTENLFGDVLSDEASVITGSLGMLPSACIGLEGPSLYEPIHGTALDIAGKNLANPVAMILSVCMMLRQSFEEVELANRIEQAVFSVIRASGGTSDIGGTLTTKAFTEHVMAVL